MSVVLLLIVLTGFSRTLYLRSFFDVPRISVRAYGHGIILTAWFVWFVVQTSLVSAGRPDLHRSLGIIGASLAAAVIITSLAVVGGMAPRLQVLFQDPHFDRATIYGVVWGDMASVLSFSALIVSAIAFRRRPEIHKRLMLLASISVVGQALGRISFWPIFAGISVLVFPVGGLIFFLGALVIYDLAKIRRVHTATLIGGAVRLSTWFGAILVARTEIGQTIVRAMAQIPS
jgi:hypothetical protein